MIIELLKESIPISWGEWLKTVNGEASCPLPYVNNGLYLNYIFNPVHSQRQMIDGYNISKKMPEEIKSIYSECNGFRLFLSSFSLYGQQERQNEMEPFDITIENFNNHARMKENKVDNDSYLFLGSVCKDADFAYCSGLKKPYVCVKKGFEEIIIDFESIEELIRYFIPRMVELYDDNFKKKRPNKEFESVPVLANAIMYIDEIL